MNPETLKRFILESVSDAAVVSNGNEVAMRCRFCGDSRSDKATKHLYVFLGNEQKPPMYNCFKCQEHGRLTKQILEVITNTDIHDEEILNGLKSSALTKRKVAGRQVYNVRWNHITDDELSRAKLNYINRRMGLSLTYQDLIENKIVLNIKDFLYQNGIEKITRKQSSIDIFNDSFLGFLSINNSMLIMKNLRPGKVPEYMDQKYLNYNIFGSQDATKIYSIPTKINILDPNPIKVHVAEGPFDLLGILYHLNNGERYQNVYINSGSKDYDSSIRMILTEYGLINCDFYVYPDNNVPLKTIRVNTLNRPVYFIKNASPGEMDMGVSKDRINAKFIK